MSTHPESPTSKTPATIETERRVDQNIPSHAVVPARGQAFGLVMNECSVNLADMARTQGSHAEITGPRIRASALSLFAKHGYAAVSMRQIASDVGLQVGALYNHIPDKQALLFSLLKGHMIDLISAWDAVEVTGDPVQRLQAFVRFHITFNLMRIDAVFISYMELRNLSPENFKAIEALRKRYETTLEDILRDGQKSGAFQMPDAKIASIAVISMLSGVTTWYREDGRLSEAEVLDIYWDMVRKAVHA